MTQPNLTDDALRDVPLPPTSGHRTLRQAFVCLGVCALLLLVFEGESLRKSGEQLQHGWQRTAVLAVGKPAGWLSRSSGMHDVKQRLVAWARPSEDLPGAAGSAAAGSPALHAGQLGMLLVTGDSMAQPLDAKLAQRFTAAHSEVGVTRDVHLGTAISQPQLLDWTNTAKMQAKKWKPGAVVVLLGANEGFPFEQPGGASVNCCGAGWINEYARRAGLMMDAWSRSGKARVYWLKLPTPRSSDRREVSDAVNAAVVNAAQSRKDRVRIVDLIALFTPGDRYRASMDVGGRPTVVREPDGVHLNEAGAQLAVDPVLSALRADFGKQVPK